MTSTVVTAAASPASADGRTSAAIANYLRRVGFLPGIAIEVSGLEKQYGDVHVLRGVDLQVQRGEVFCLLGPNGAGKTTTVEILEGFREPTAGMVRVLGFDPALHHAEFRSRIGVVLQESGFPRYIRVAELLDGWRAYYPRPLPLSELLEVVELQGHSDSLVRHLSGGQKRRLDFALALAGDPDLIFLDEPTTGFDPEARRRCWKAIENLREMGKTIVLTTHYLDEAEQLADRVAILSSGRIEMVGTPRELASRVGALTTVSFSLPPGVVSDDLPSPDEVDLSFMDGRAEASVADGAKALRTLLEWARECGLENLHDIAVIPPTLEDTYLKLLESD